MQSTIKLFISFILTLACTSSFAITKSQYHALINDVVTKIEQDSGKKLKIKFHFERNSRIINKIASDETYMSQYMDKETVTILDGASTIHIYRSNSSMPWDKWAYIVIPDEGITAGHPAIIDICADGKVYITLDLKSLLLDGNVRI